MAKMDTVKVADWSTQTAFTVPSSFSISGGNLVCPPGALYANPVAYLTTAHDMTSSSFDVEIVYPGSSSSDGWGLEAWFGVRPDPTASWSNEAGYIITGDGNLYPIVYIGGTSTQGTSTAYSTTNHKYLRVREAGGTTYWESSPDRGTWTQIWSRANPFQMTAVHAYVGSSVWQTETNIVSPTYGDVNGGIPAPTGDAGADQTASPWTTVTLTGTGTGTWTQVTGPTVTLSGSGATRTFTAPPSMSAQSLVFDYGGDTTTITIPRAQTGLRQADGSVKPIRVRLVAPTQGYEQVTVNVDASIRSFKVSTHNSGGTATAKLITRPPQVAVGDLLMNFAVADSSGVANFTPPAGWTQLYELSAGTGGLPRIFCHYKVAVSGDTTITGWNWTTYATGADGASLCMAIKDWSGSTANLRNAISGTTQTTPTAPSVTPATARNLLLSCAASAGPGNVWGWIPPQGAGNVAYGHNGNGYSSVIVARETYNSTAATGGRTFGLNVAPALNNAKLGIAVAVPSGTATKTITQMLSEYAHTGGSGGDLTDTGNLTFQDTAGTSSTYHLFAEGLDWTKNVGLLVYTDGSGEWGLDAARLDHQYLLGTPTGMRAVARRQNMILLTPKAPGNGCLDGDGTCWYDDSNDGTSPIQKLEWSNELIRYILTRYNIDRRRIAIGGYSSGAQWTTAWWGPRYASDVMLDGVAVAISYGGQPRVAPRITAAYKAAVEHVWDVGTLDDAYTQPTWDDGVQTGRAWYQGEGFAVTDLVLQQGAGHDRVSTSPTDFGPIMEREIIARVPPA